MTERKPPGVNWESWLDRQIREATERGDFDDLPGKGKPIPGAGKPDNENWWITGYLQREGATGDGALPASILLNRDVERLADAVRTLRTEREVREAVAKINVRIAEYHRMPTEPHVQIATVDADAVVQRWRSA